ncbi:MAG: pantoate--beta-alanine ligase [Ilumatobacteraceae bacterium]
MNAPLQTVRTPSGMTAWSRSAQQAGETIALVPTMGALHRGHLALIEHARTIADRVVVSIFVNPLQFDRPDDFEHYPRPIDADVAVCAEHGVDAVYAPTAAVMYPAGYQTTVRIGALASVMEGASRPGHFDGVATVVTKLFTAVRPDLAVFGEKDFQQLAIVRRLSADLDLGVHVIGRPTVREADGLALSSRNTRLDEAQRRAALAVPRALEAAVRSAVDGARRSGTVIEAALRVLADEPLAAVDYVAVFDTDDLSAVTDLEAHPHDRVRVAAAAFFGDVRLIDNRALFPP